MLPGAHVALVLRRAPSSPEPKPVWRAQEHLCKLANTLKASLGRIQLPEKRCARSPSLSLSTSLADFGGPETARFRNEAGTKREFANADCSIQPPVAAN